MSDLEQRLRDMLTDPAYALPGWPDAAERVRAGIHARRRRSLVAVLSAGTAALAAALVGAAIPWGVPATPQPHPSPTDAVIWLDLPPSFAPEPHLSPRLAGSPCAIDQMHFDGAETNGAGGTSILLIRLTNTGHGPCTMTERPAVRGKRNGSVRTLPAPGTQVHMGVSDPGSVPATVDPGEQVLLEIETYGGCLDGRPETVYSDAVLRFTGRDIPLHQSFNVTCGFNMGRWFRAPLVQPSPPPKPTASLRIAIAAPSSVRRGATLEFVVTLTNPLTVPVTFDPCPNYLAEVRGVPLKAVGVRQLNCAVGAIPADGSVRYAMRLPIPDGGSYTGPGTLVWEFWDGGPSASVPLTIL